MKSFFSGTFRSIAFSALAAALFFAAAAAALPPRAHVSLAFTIAERMRQETAQYSYDGYYSLQASNLISDTLISWLSTPSVIKQIHAEAGVPITDAEALSAAGRTFRAKKFSSQNVVVTFDAAGQEEAAKLAAATAKTLSARADGLVEAETGAPLFSIAPGEPVIAVARFSPVRAALAGACVGAFIGLALAYAVQKKKPRP